MRSSLIAGLLLCAAAAFAQSNPAFEVAAVKASGITAASWARFLPGGRLSAASWLQQLVQIAYGVEDYQVSGGPSWVREQWYEIEAKAPNPEATRDEMAAMLRTLLEDRFKLQVRREEKTFPIFALKPDKGGLKLTPLKQGEPSKCTRDNSFICGIRTPAQLADSIRGFAGRLVLDRTGVEGRFDILLDFDYSSRRQTTPSESEKPSLTAALREQLGLRLEPDSVRLPVLVIEKVERPGEN